jgi:hypothetical protein
MNLWALENAAIEDPNLDKCSMIVFVKEMNINSASWIKEDPKYRKKKSDRKIISDIDDQ